MNEETCEARAEALAKSNALYELIITVGSAADEAGDILVDFADSGGILGGAIGRIASIASFFATTKENVQNSIDSLAELEDADSIVNLAQQLAAAHGSVHNHFNKERHLYSRQNYKENRTAALVEWQQLCAC